MSDLVLVSGLSGFIAKHVTLELLKAGYRVRGTVRNRAAGEAVKSTLSGHDVDTANLEVVEADLTRDEGWGPAMSGCRFVQHVASPFPMKQPRNREALVPAARDGALRVLRHAFASGVERVVATSSMVAMMYRAGRPAEFTVRESDWTDPDWGPLSAYIVSKTRAERAMWDRLEGEVQRERLTTVNPGFVLGPALDARAGTSLGVLQLMLKGKYPALPRVAYPVVDVRDVAQVHVRAMEAEGAGGRRLIATSETLSLLQMADILRRVVPERARKVPGRGLPDALVRMLALVDPALRSVTADLGSRPVADAGYVTEITGARFRPGAEAVEAAARSLITHRMV